MRAYAKIKFDRALTDQHVISLGGYEVWAGGKKYGFDFTYSERSQDLQHPEIVEFSLRDEDDKAFPEAISLKEHLSEIEKVEDFYVYIGEDTDPGINCLELLNFVIEVAGTGEMPPHRDTEYIHHEVYQSASDWIIQYQFTDKLLKQVNDLWKSNQPDAHPTNTYRVCVTKYGYVDINAVNSEAALKSAEKLSDSAFDWGEAGDATVVETFCNKNF